MTNESIFYIVGLIIGAIGGYCARWAWSKPSKVVEINTTIDLKDFESVVRCKDCKHLKFSDCYGECSAGHRGIVRPDDFCSYGERKETE